MRRQLARRASLQARAGTAREECERSSRRSAWLISTRSSRAARATVDRFDVLWSSIGRLLAGAYSCGFEDLRQARMLGLHDGCELPRSRADCLDARPEEPLLDFSLIE